MRTLITGYAGFIGTHLVRHLIKSTGEEIVTAGRHKPPPGTRHFPCDIADRETLKKILRELKPEIIYHLAGTSRLDPTLSFPEYFAKNCLPTFALSEVLTDLSLPITLFFASTVHLYAGEGEFREDSPISTSGDLPFSKYLAEEALRHHAKANPKSRVIVGRFADCSGPGQGAGFPIPDLCLTLPPEKPLQKELLPPLRGFIDVRDLVSLARKVVALRGEDNFEIYNFASSFAVGEKRIDNSKLGSRITLHFRPIENSMRDFWEWHIHPRT